MRSPIAAFSALAGAGLALALLTGCGGEDAPAEPQFEKKSTTFTVEGTVTVAGAGRRCSGSGPYADVSAGAPVTVFAGSEAVGQGQLGPGSAARGDCRFDFTIPGVPIDAGPDYAVQVSDADRVEFTRAQAAALSLTLG